MLLFSDTATRLDLFSLESTLLATNTSYLTIIPLSVGD